MNTDTIYVKIIAKNFYDDFSVKVQKMLARSEALFRGMKPRIKKKG